MWGVSNSNDIWGGLSPDVKCGVFDKFQIPKTKGVNSKF